MSGCTKDTSYMIYWHLQKNEPLIRDPATSESAIHVGGHQCPVAAVPYHTATGLVILTLQVPTANFDDIYK
jgi:hypothetical protein